MSQLEVEWDEVRRWRLIHSSNFYRRFGSGVHKNLRKIPGTPFDAATDDLFSLDKPVLEVICRTGIRSFTLASGRHIFYPPPSPVPDSHHRVEGPWQMRLYRSLSVSLDPWGGF